ncbi:MAG TPA: diaminopimelate epimerase [Gammaproteobacteria bacterium]|nr:diaminopimelate epimerase [Gammaproteobacteria bacterium]
MDFHKMQALGNDFIIIDDVKNPLNIEQIQSLACRKTGVGFDQLLEIKPNISQHQVDVSIYNADGSSAQMCGNGLRCVTKYLIDHYQYPNQFVVEINQRSYHVEKIHDDEFAVNMKAPSTCAFHEKNDIPYVLVDIGNLHAVVFKEVSNKESLFKKLYHKHNCNVHFAELHSLYRMDIKPYERGVGATLACGSGACAAVWAAYQFYQLAPKAHVIMPGGEVMVSINVTTSELWLHGPAEYSFFGQIDEGL